jgi:predicted RNA binding protein YcfA (HicA-like mRNA interferase family)
MRLPRDLSGPDLVRILQPFGYVTTRQTGSPIRLTTIQNGEHHITIPNHPVLRVGTLAAILLDVAQHLGIDRDELSRRLFS